MPFSYDERLYGAAGVKLPASAEGAYLPERDLADALLLPRYGAQDRAEREAVGAVPVQLPPGARASFLSFQRHVCQPAWLAPARTRSLREHIDAALKRRSIVVYFDERGNAPVRIALSPPITRGEAKELFRRAGYDVSATKKPADVMLSSVSLLTETSKMGCFSFNLPAGPPALGGTCPAATLGFMYGPMSRVVRAQKAKRERGMSIDPESFICNGCYAGKNSYGNPSNVIGMQARLFVVLDLLRGGGRVKFLPTERFADLYARAKSKQARNPLVAVMATAKKRRLLDAAPWSLAELLVWAIEAARGKTRERRAVLESFGYTRAEYARTEARLRQIAAKKQIRAILGSLSRGPSARLRRELEGQLDEIASASGLTRAELVGRDARERKVFQVWQLPDPDFFRIHDAGDFFSDAYFREWLAVCRHFEQDRLRFWAPTRVWAMRGVLKESSLESIPANLALRPSTLHFRDAAPTAARLHRQLKLPRFKPGKGGGLSAASGSAPERPAAKDWDCPAYRHWSVRGGGAVRLDPTKHPSGGTCILARGPKRERGCRVCWNGKDGRYHDLVVFYQEH